VGLNKQQIVLSMSQQDINREIGNILSKRIKGEVDEAAVKRIVDILEIRKKLTTSIADLLRVRTLFNEVNMLDDSEILVHQIELLRLLRKHANREMPIEDVAGVSEELKRRKLG
jgi:hypothetical protein